MASCTHQPVVTNYYFDSANGNDNNRGTSARAPFKSLAKISQLELKGGDSVLLKSGAEFGEQLYISCRGEDGRPVVVGKYGDRAMPHIRCDGTVSAAVHIYNSENIVVRDIEVSNGSTMPAENIHGVWVELSDYGVAKNTTLDNLYIHDVRGCTFAENADRGSAVRIQNAHEEADSLLSCFDGLTIQNCYIKNCRRDGIRMHGNWLRNKWKPNLNVAVRNNIIDGVPGDGIVLAGCDGGLIEYNEIKNCPVFYDDGKIHETSDACDGIWPWSCDNTLVQYNIVGGHKSVVDGYAYDSDWNCTNNLFQYNVSYDNDGGFMLVIGTSGWPEGTCINGNIGTVIKYNVSINDGIRAHKVQGRYFSPVMHFTGYTKNTVTEKNIFVQYSKTSPQADRTLVHFDEHDRMFGQGDIFRNNYISVAEPTVAVKEEKSVGNVYANNIYVGELSAPATGFTKHEGRFGKTVWYDPVDSGWTRLIEFIQDKTILVNGKPTKITEAIGWE